MTIQEALQSELQMLATQYENEVKAAQDRLARRGVGGHISDHLGHNLASHAANLSAIAGKVEAVKRVLMFVEQEANPKDPGSNVA